MFFFIFLDTFGHVLDTFGSFLIFSVCVLDIFGHAYLLNTFWILLDTFGHAQLWTPPFFWGGGTFGYFWILWDTSWIRLDTFGYIWTRLDTFGHVWTRLGIFVCTLDIFRHVVFWTLRHFYLDEMHGAAKMQRQYIILQKYAPRAGESAIVSKQFQNILYTYSRV